MDVQSEVREFLIEWFLLWLDAHSERFFEDTVCRMGCRWSLSERKPLQAGSRYRVSVLIPQNVPSRILLMRFTRIPFLGAMIVTLTEAMSFAWVALYLIERLLSKNWRRTRRAPFLDTSCELVHVVWLCAFSPEWFVDNKVGLFRLIEVWSNGDMYSRYTSRIEGLNSVEYETFHRKVILKVFETTEPVESSVGRLADFATQTGYGIFLQGPGYGGISSRLGEHHRSIVPSASYHLCSAEWAKNKRVSKAKARMECFSSWF